MDIKTAITINWFSDIAETEEVCAMCGEQLDSYDSISVAELSGDIICACCMEDVRCAACERDY